MALDENIVFSYMDQVVHFFDKITPGFGDTLALITVFMLGLVLYGILIWNFYRFLAKRDIIKFDLKKHEKESHPILKEIWRIIAYIVKFAIMYPFASFLWFAGLTLLLFFLAKTHTIPNILLISITLVSATRIASYYNEDLSKDFAKMLPFALLGIAIIDAQFFSIDLVLQRFDALPSLISQAWIFIVFSILLEIVLRIILVIKLMVLGENPENIVVEKQKEIVKKELEKEMGKV